MTSDYGNDPTVYWQTQVVLLDHSQAVFPPPAPVTMPVYSMEQAQKAPLLELRVVAETLAHSDSPPYEEAYPLP